jgi:hypothetical protein
MPGYPPSTFTKCQFAPTIGFMAIRVRGINKSGGSPTDCHFKSGKQLYRELVNYGLPEPILIKINACIERCVEEEADRWRDYMSRRGHFK